MHGVVSLAQLLGDFDFNSLLVRTLGVALS